MCLRTKILGLSMTIKKKKKTAWSGVYWEHGIEKDVTGWELKLPDGRVVPQLVGDETYTYLGTEMTTGWNNGSAQKTLRKKVVRKCRQVIGLVGRVPGITHEQMGKAISLGVGGIIGYYGRATVITWDDCVEIEKARAAALTARGFTPGVPRVQIYQRGDKGGMDAHEHAYTYAGFAYTRHSQGL